jgi:hypothetical protein
VNAKEEFVRMRVESRAERSTLIATVTSALTAPVRK